MTDQYRLQAQLYAHDGVLVATQLVAPYLVSMGMSGPTRTDQGQLFEGGLVGRVQVLACDDLEGGTRFDIRAPDGVCVPVGHVLEPLRGLGGFFK